MSTELDSASIVTKFDKENNNTKMEIAVGDNLKLNTREREATENDVKARTRTDCVACCARESSLEDGLGL